MPAEIPIYAAVEGIVDEAVALRLVKHVKAHPAAVYGKNGKPHLLKKIQGYNNAAQNLPWIVNVDLDRDADCALHFRANCLPNPVRFMCFRIAVREVEAWLLADREAVASFMRVAIEKVPTNPESLTDPKQTMVNLASRSRSRGIRKDMAPR